MTGRRFFRTRTGSRVACSTRTKRASGTGPRGVATGTASRPSTELRSARPRRALISTPSRAVGAFTSPAFRPDSDSASTWATCSTLTPDSAASTGSTPKRHFPSAASTVQSTSTTPGVVSITDLTRRAASSRIESSAAYTSATRVERTGGPGGISAILALAPNLRAIESTAGRIATAMA